MASANAKLTKPSYSSVHQTYADISFSASLSGSEKDLKATGYSWTFSPSGAGSGSSGTARVSGLTAGKSNTITGTVTINYSYTVQEWNDKKTWVEESKDKDGKTIPAHWEGGYEDVTKTSSTSGSDHVTVYTHPVPFSFGFSSNDSIHLKLKADGNWADWCDAIRQYRSWREQSSHYNDALSYGGKSFKASSGQVITAELINAAYSYANGKSTTVVSNSSSNNNSIITAKVFNNLNIASSGDQTFSYTF